MKAHLAAIVQVALALAGGTAAPCAAQSVSGAPVTRSDLTVAVSWLNADKSGLSTEHYDDWINRGVLASGTFGWFWTDHLKTEIEAAISGRLRRSVYDRFTVGSRQTSLESTYHFGTRRLAIGQQYQFYRNVWFHPSLTAGVDVAWEEIEQSDRILSIYDFETRQSQFNPQPEIEQPTRKEVHVRPFTSVGFKAYMTQRAYFRSDMRFVFHGGIDEVLIRFGFGVDF
jgi:hypothetical protein